MKTTNIMRLSRRIVCPTTGMLVIGLMQYMALESLATPPVVKTVPWVASNPLIPHTTYAAKAVRLKGTCDQQGSNLTWRWDFGDGSPVASGTVNNRFVIEATHTYSGSVGTVFTAHLTVENTSTGESTSTAYYVAMLNKTLETEVNVAIDEGLWYLQKDMYRYTDGSGVDWGDWTSGQAGGYASYGYYGVTVANINAFEVNGHLESGNPSDPYTETVQRGMRSLFAWLNKEPIGMQALGNPDVSGDGFGIVQGSQGQPYYQTGMFLDAIVASGTPNAVTTTGGAGIFGRTYKAIAQDIVDDFAWAQYDDINYGGWRYSANSWPDNSVCQWQAIGLIAAERNWGCFVPQWVKNANVGWLRYSQNGGGYFGYTDSNPVWGPHAVTPSGMVQLDLDAIGRGMTGPSGWPSWDAAETYIRNNFQNPPSWGAGSSLRAYYYGLFSFTKAMLLYPYDGTQDVAAPGQPPKPIKMLKSQSVGVAPIDWYSAQAANGDPCDGVARTLLSSQSSVGYWYGNDYTSSQYLFETAWAIMMLHQTIINPGAPVAVATAVPNPGIVGQQITLSGANSYQQDKSKSIVKWEWALDGDGVFTVSGVTVTTTFSAVGNYPVKLRVTDNSLPPQTAETIITVIINTPPVPPTADAGGPYIFYPGFKWFLDGRKSVNPDDGKSEPHNPPYPGDFITQYAWDLNGDGTYDVFGPTPDITGLLAPGSYLITLRVTDNTALSYPDSGLDNLSGTATAQVIVKAAGVTCVTLTVTPQVNQIELDWTAYAGADHYNIYRGQVQGGPYDFLASSATSPYVDNPGVQNMTWYYVVRPAALNGDEICQSNEGSGKPIFPPATVRLEKVVMPNAGPYFYKLHADSPSFPDEQLRVWVGDTKSAQVVGPFKDADILCIRTKLSTAKTIPGSGAITETIWVKGSATLWAVDPWGNAGPPTIVP